MVFLFTPQKRQGIFMSNYLGLRRNKRRKTLPTPTPPCGSELADILSSLITKSRIRSPCSSRKLSNHDISLSSMFILAAKVVNVFYSTKSFIR